MAREEGRHGGKEEDSLGEKLQGGRSVEREKQGCRAMGERAHGVAARRRPWRSFCVASKSGEVELAPMGEEGQGREQAWAPD
jgi:hypothetical protein